MATVHLFITIDRFQSTGDILQYVHKTYNEDGEALSSAFIIDVELSEYEPGCIEVIQSKLGRPVPLAELLIGASYSEQWLPNVDCLRLADAAICVFPPNRIQHPTNCKLDYMGSFKYQP